MGRTTLDDDTYVRCLKSVKARLKSAPAIRNRELRQLTGINYDQAIRFFARAAEEGILKRRGQASGTYYVLLEEKP
jgi:predicted HTH transcriptional regulator